MFGKMVDLLRTNDSDAAADWWAKYWTRPFTLADCGYGNCTHQNHQEGKWKPIKRGTGCGARGDPRQSLGTFISYLVGFIKNASEESENDMIVAGRCNAFIRDPQPTKKEWDKVQALHPKCMICSCPTTGTKEDAVAFSMWLYEVTMHEGDADAPLYLRIQRWHAAQISEWIEGGKKLEDYKVPRKSLFDSIMMPSSRLLYTLDPENKRNVVDVLEDLREYMADYLAFLSPHKAKYKPIVESWDLPKYLEVMDNFFLISRIKHPDSPWGDIFFKCSCKHCHVHVCCRESIIWSMLLNHELKLPPKYAFLEPYNRKKKGRPTEKRVAKLLQGEDARPFVDRAAPKVTC